MKSYPFFFFFKMSVSVNGTLQFQLCLCFWTLHMLCKKAVKKCNESTDMEKYVFILRDRGNLSQRNLKHFDVHVWICRVISLAGRKNKPWRWRSGQVPWPKQKKRKQKSNCSIQNPYNFWGKILEVRLLHRETICPQRWLWVFGLLRRHACTEWDSMSP